MRCATVFSLVFLWSYPLWAAEESSLPPEPEIVFLSPLGGQRGTTQTIDIWGKTLDKAVAVLSETEGITARVEKVAAVPEDAPEKKTESDHRVTALVNIGATVEPGNHWLRVVTPRGVTNRLLFRVTVDPVIQEAETPHSNADHAQSIVAPVVVNGTIATVAEADFFQFDVTKPCEMAFEVRPSHAALAKRCRLQIGVFEKQASFLDPNRLARLSFADVEKARGEKVTMNTDPREHEGTRIPLRHRFPRAGRYFVSVSSLRGRSGPDFVYQFRMVEADDADRVELERNTWRERSFTRKLSGDHLKAVRKRGARHATGDVVVKEVGETEPNGELAAALEVPVPGIAHGTIAEPGDVDLFKFTAADGQKLAFEVETPRATVPQFNPVITILDAKGGEQLSSLQRTEKYTKATRPHLIELSTKIIRTFEKSGDYYVRVQDATVRKGSPSFVYRVLIRSQIPHVGNTALETRTRGPEDARVDPLRVNLVAGQARKITLLLDHEEGFFIPSNQIAISFEGLPEGVEVLVGSGQYRATDLFPLADILNTENHRPVAEKIVAVLQASENAPTTAVPAWVTASARAVVDGVPAEKLIVERIPVMVLPPASDTPEKRKAAF